MNKLLSALLVSLLALGFAAVSTATDKKVAPAVRKARKVQKAPDFFVTPPPFSEGIFPCSMCHEGLEPNPNRRELTFHTEIQDIFDHAAEQRWCLDCHNPNNRDRLRLASGKLVTFEESEYLCGQCHGTIFRDWKVGVHGKRTGFWDAKKLYRLCVQCHNPHSPRFKPLMPLPPPVKPGDIKVRKLNEEDIPRNPLGEIRPYTLDSAGKIIKD